MKRDYKLKILSALILAAVAAFGLPLTAKAQQEQSQAAVSQDEWSAGELDNLVAPIALYPDPLLSQMLVASTYPLEVVEAYQWLQRNSGLSGQALMDAARQQPWDSSVQALVATPDALDRLNQDIQWTTDLGNAFLAQEADVMNAVQQMRTRALADGRLQSTPQQTVTADQEGAQQTIVIEPANSEVIYVPVYDPFYVWGPPLVGFYPPLYYPDYGFDFGAGYNLSFYYGGWSGWGSWGWTPNWLGRTVFVDNLFFHNYGFRRHPGNDSHGKTVWAHNPEHRLGVPYSSGRVASRFRGSETVPRAGRRNSRYEGTQRGSRSAFPQSRNYRNPTRSAAVPQNQFRNRRNEAGPRVRPFENRTQPRYQDRQRSYSSRNAVESPRVPRFQTQGRSGFSSPRVYRQAPPRAERHFGGGFNRGGHSFSSRSGRRHR